MSSAVAFASDDNSRKCSECLKIFVQKKHLYAHLRRIHDKDPDIKKPTPGLKCDVCEKLFSSNLTLKRHKRKFHESFETQEHNYYQESQALKRSKLYCPGADCSTKCLSYRELRAHLHSKHDFMPEVETIEFNSLEDFYRWKDEIEIKTVSCYSQETGSKSLKNDIHKKFFNCHRSYKYEPSGKNMRALKHSGSVKIGKACPSRMEVTVQVNGECSTKVYVKFWKTHHGHIAELGHVRLNKAARAEIAAKLQQGVSFDHILGLIGDTDGTGNQRLHRIEKKDLHNIVRDFNLDYVAKRHQNDAVSVNLQAEEMLTLKKESSVLHQNNVTYITNREKIIESADLLIDLAGKVTVTDQNYDNIQTHLNKCIDLLKEEKTILTTENVIVQKKVDKRTGLFAT